MAQTVSTKLTPQMVDKIDMMVEQGQYVSRSEALRAAARLMVRKQRGSLKGKLAKEHLTEEDKAMALRALAKERGWKL